MPRWGSLVYSGRNALPLCPEPVKMSRNPEKRYWYEVVAEMLAAEGVSDCFALLGDANMHMATHLDSLGTRMIHVRHEHCAVAAAMGYARKTGRTGVATVTCGPGLTQLMTALPAAVRAHIPLVVIAGEAPLHRHTGRLSSGTNRNAAGGYRHSLRLVGKRGGGCPGPAGPVGRADAGRIAAPAA